MAVSTEKIIPGILPPKEETQGVDFVGILDSLDPKTLTDEQLLKFAPRDPFVTGVGGGDDEYYRFESGTYVIPNRPIQESLKSAKLSVTMERRDLEQAAHAWENGVKNGYRNARAALVSAIGAVACLEYVQRKFDAMSEEDLKKEQEDRNRWERYLAAKEKAEKVLYSGERIPLDASEEEVYHDLIAEERHFLNPPYGYMAIYDKRFQRYFIPILSKKLQILRGVVGLTQRDFAKAISYNVNKYALLEQGKLEKLGFHSIDEAFPESLIKRIADATHANPYWLEKNTEESVTDVDREERAETAHDAQYPLYDYPMFCDDEVIEEWWDDCLKENK